MVYIALNKPATDVSHRYMYKHPTWVMYWLPA